MIDNQVLAIESFLAEIREIEAKVTGLIEQTNLSEQEKRYILDHIMVVPGNLQKGAAE